MKSADKMQILSALHLGLACAQQILSQVSSSAYSASKAMRLAKARNDVASIEAAIKLVETY